MYMYSASHSSDGMHVYRDTLTPYPRESTSPNKPTFPPEKSGRIFARVRYMRLPKHKAFRILIKQNVRSVLET